MKDSFGGMFYNEELTNKPQQGENAHQSAWQSSNLNHVDISHHPQTTILHQRLGSGRLYHPVDKSIGALLISLSNSDEKLRMQAIRAVEAMGMEAPLRVIQALEDILFDRFASISIRMAVIEVLGELGGNEVKNVLLRTVHDQEWVIRASVIQALGRLEKDAPLDVLEEALNDEDESVRDAAIWALKPLVMWALEVCGDRGPLNALIAALEDESEIVRAAAVEVLSDVGDHAPLESLVLAVKDEGEGVRLAASTALGKLDEQICRNISTDFLLAALTDVHEDMRTVAAWILGERIERIAVEPLVLALQDSSRRVRDTVSWALKRLSKKILPSDIEIEVWEQWHVDDKDTPQMVSEPIGYTPAQDLLMSLVNFLGSKKGYVVAEVPAEHVLTLNCYYRGEENASLEDMILNPRKTSTYVQDLQKALRADDETIQKVARQILEKREQYSWKEAFVISLDLYADQKFFFSEDAPEQIIVCSTSYDSILEDNMSICQSITKLHYEPQHTTDQWASLWIKKYLKSVFQYPEKVRGIKMWYGLGTASA